MKIAFSAKNYLCGFDSEYKIPMPEKIDTFTFGTKNDAYDALMMSATLIDDEGERSFFVTLEVSFIRPLLVQHIYGSLHKVAPDFKKENLFVNASHTHIGPVYSKDQYASNHMPGAVEADDNLFMDLVLHWSSMAAQMYTECAANLKDFYADIASVALEGCFSSRVGLDAPCDKTATVIRFFDRKSDRQLGMWLNIACHSVFHPEFGMMGSDLIGGTAKKLQTLYGVYAQPFAGCQGNTSTKHTGRRTTGIKDSIEEMDRVSGEIVEQIRERAVFEKFEADTCKIHNLVLNYDCDVDPVRLQFELDKIITAQAQDNNLERYASQIKMLSQRTTMTKKHGALAASIVKLGQLKLAMINGELENTIGTELTHHNGNQHCLVACYVNGQEQYQLDSSVKNDGWSVPAGLASVMVNMVRADLMD